MGEFAVHVYPDDWAGAPREQTNFKENDMPGTAVPGLHAAMNSAIMRQLVRRGHAAPVSRFPYPVSRFSSCRSREGMWHLGA